MASVVKSKKACTVNPLKMSQPVGGALAFMGVRGSMPLLHGSQGCTSFGLVLFVRHFRAAADHRHERGGDRARRLRERRAGGAEHRPAHPAQPDRHLLDRRHRDQGRRRGGFHHPDPRAPSGTGAYRPGVCLDTGLQGRVPGRLGGRRHAHGRDPGRGAKRPAAARPGEPAARLPPDARRHRGAARDHRGVRSCAGDPAGLVGLAGRPHPGRLHAHHAGWRHAHRHRRHGPLGADACRRRADAPGGCGAGSQNRCALRAVRAPDRPAGERRLSDAPVRAVRPAGAGQIPPPAQSARRRHARRAFLFRRLQGGAGGGAGPAVRGRLVPGRDGLPDRRRRHHHRIAAAAAPAL